MHVVIVTRRAAQDEQYWSGVGQARAILFPSGRDDYRELYHECLCRRIAVPPVTCWFLLGYALPSSRIPHEVLKPPRRRARKKAA